MRWYSEHNIHTKSELINLLIAPVYSEHYEEKTLQFHVCNDYIYGVTILWSLIEFNIKNDDRNILLAGKYRYIKCNLIKKIDEAWSYSYYCELSPPPYYSCPLNYLELANLEVNQEWRTQVRNYHQLQK